MKLLFLLIGTLVSSFALGNTVNASVAIDSSNGVVLRAVDYLQALNHLTNNKSYKPPVAVSQSQYLLATLAADQPVDLDTAFAIIDTAYAATTGALATDLPAVKEPQTVMAPVTDSLEWRGRQDAKLYFKRSQVMAAAGLGTLGGIVTAGITLVIPITLAVVPPKIKAGDVLDLNLWQDQAYRRGYQKEAAKKKRLQVLKGTGLGVVGAAALAGALYLMITSLSH